MYCILHGNIPRRSTSLLALGLGFVARVAAASSSDELFAQGQAHEQAREDDIAIHRYTDAITLDPAHERSYFALGRLRSRRGDYREAEKVYSVALLHLPARAPLFRERGRARWFAGFRDDAENDLETYLRLVPEEATFRELSSWYGIHDRPLAQLSVWRRLLTIGIANNNSDLVTEARMYTTVLVGFTKPVDPVAFPASDTPLRRGLARMAGRGLAPN
jgi:tetratricopeptide (TPR) repeat protein